MIERWFTAGFRARDPKAVERIVAMLQAQAPAGYTAACLAIRDMDQRAQVADIFEDFDNRG